MSPKEVQTRRGNINHRKRQVLVLPMGIDDGLNPKLAGVHFVLAYRAHGVLTRKGITSGRQLPSAPSFEITEMSGGDSVTRQCTLIGNSLDDEQRCDDLSNPSSYQPTCPTQIGIVRKHEPESE